MDANPIEVDVERLDQQAHAGVEIVLAAHQDPVERRECDRYRVVRHIGTDDGNKSLAETFRALELDQAHARRDGRNTDRENKRVCPIYRGMDFFEPIGSRRYAVPIDPRVTSRARVLQSVHETADPRVRRK